LPLVAQHGLVGLVEVHAFLDYGLIVFMQWDAAGIERTRPLKVTGLDLKRIECAVVIGIEGTSKNSDLREFVRI
jgi:hypothetical protein